MVVLPEAKILAHMSVLVDSLRCRILSLLESQELTVSDLCGVLQLPQSTVSRHLKILAEKRWLVSRRHGTRHLYRLQKSKLDESAQRLWDLTRAEFCVSAVGLEDQERLASLLATQSSRSKDFFAMQGAEWDVLRDELFGSNFHLVGLMGLLDNQWTVADLGCGSGPASEAMAPFVRKIIAVDGSRAMLHLAGKRLNRFPNVELRTGDLAQLPMDDAVADAATLILVLHHLLKPGAAIKEAARILRPGGKLLIVDMKSHDRLQYRNDMGHVWLGFSEQTMNEFVQQAGMVELSYGKLPPSPPAKGPNLFALTATKQAVV